MKLPKNKDTMTIDDVRSALRKRLGIKSSRTGIYYYLNNKRLPLPIGFGKGKHWKRDEIAEWIAKQLELKK